MIDVPDGGFVVGKMVVGYLGPIVVPILRIERNDRYLEMPIRDFSVTEFYKLIKKDNEVVGVYFDPENHLVSFIVKEKTG